MATNPFNIVPAKKTSPFNIPPAKPSVAGILDRALTGGFVGKTLSAADRFAQLSPEEKKKLLETGSTIQTTGPLKPEVLQKNIELKEATQKAAAKKFFNFEKSPLSISAAPTELIEAQKSPEAAAAYEKEQARRRLQYVRQNEGYFPAVGEALKQYGQAKVEAMQPVLEFADTAATKVEEQGHPILGGAVRGAKGLYQSSVGATGEAARQLGEGNVGGAAFTYGLGKLMNSSPTGMAWTAVMEQKPVKEHVQPVLDAWNNELDTFFAEQKNNPFSPMGAVLKESGKLLPFLLFDKVSRIPFKSKKTITLQNGKTFEIPVDRKWYADAKQEVFNDILQLANDPAKFFKEKQFGLSIKAVGDEAERGKMTSLKDMRTKLPRAGIEKPAPLPDYTTRVLDMLGDRKTVSRQFINDLTNRPELRQAERDLIRSKLSKFKGDTIDVPEFAASVRGEVLPLKIKRQGIDMISEKADNLDSHDFFDAPETQYENITLPDELRGEVQNYAEHIYESPITTSGGNVHNFDTKNYFAHSRIEDLPDNTRRVIEVQSDLFQKGRLESELPPYKTLAEYKGKQYQLDSGSAGFYYLRGEKGTLITAPKNEVKLPEFDSDISKLGTYRNSWYERVIREEVKQASKDGKTKVQFPTGETAMKIEGLGNSENFVGRVDGIVKTLKKEDLTVGMEVMPADTTSRYVITDVLGDGKFKAVPRDMKIAENGKVAVTPYLEASENAKEFWRERQGEEFDISGKIDTNNPIYKYYEKDVQKFLKREYPDMKRVKDAQGVEWFEVDTTPKQGQLSYGEKPVFAFKEKPREGGISEEARARAGLQMRGQSESNLSYSTTPQGQERVDGKEYLPIEESKNTIGKSMAGLEVQQLQDRQGLNIPSKENILPVQPQAKIVSGNALGATVPAKQTLVNKVAELDAVKGEFDNLTDEIRTPIEAEIYNELASSKAGERYQLPDGTFTGMASTFPKWIPYEDLRTSDLVQKVMKSMFSGKELKGKAGQLQEIVLAEIEKRMKTHELYGYYSEMRDYVKKLQTETAQEFRAGVGDIGNAEQLPFGVEGLEGAPPSAPTPGMLNLAKDVLKYKDISGFYGQMRDVFRNFKKVFGDRFAAVKKEILDPFDSAKGMLVGDWERLLKDLDRVIVKELGIKKGSKESAAVMDYGEKLISFADLEKYFGTAKAEKIVAADRWFRNKYNELIDEVNNVRTRIYPGNPGKLVPKRQDYYRHFQELPQTLLGIRSIFEDPVAISPSLSGISEFTQPKSKWAGFMQKRKGNASVRDAVGGFLDYVPTATYAKWIDPQIAKFRGLAKTLAAATEDTKNLNNFIEFLQDFSNDLAGKTNAADRYIQKSIPGGRTTFKAIDLLNKHTKANAVLGNSSSTLAQLFNIPQGIATAKQHSMKGMARTLGQIFHENKPMMESSFLKERYARSLFYRFETRYLAKTKNFAAWFTGVGDEIGTKFIWNSLYEKALSEKIPNPIKYADDITRELVGGRGIGEVPLAQKSKLFQLVAPFQLEVTNLWYVMGDMVSKKDFAALATLFAANFLMNRAAEQIRGNPVVFDPINATIDGIQRLRGERDWKAGAGKLLGRLGGEVLSNIPFGSDFAEIIVPENKQNDIFGDANPTRFGQGLIPKVIQGGLGESWPYLLPFGGAQVKKTYSTVKALMNNGQVKSSSGKTTNFVIRNKSLPNLAKGLLFGQYATEEGQKYLNRNKRTKSLFNIPSASGDNPFKLQSGNTSGNPFVLPRAR